MQKKLLSVVAVLAVSVALTAPGLSQAELADGQVVKIDRSEAKITLKHGPLKKFDMEGMTMSFRVQDAAMLQKVKVGEKIKFEADKIDGKFTIIKMQKAK